jgi:hypothetical protein
MLPSSDLSGWLNLKTRIDDSVEGLIGRQIGRFEALLGKEVGTKKALLISIIGARSDESSVACRSLPRTEPG